MSDKSFELHSHPVNGLRVRQARELRGLTQTALAELLSVDQTMIAHMERGTKQPGDEVLEHLASELELPEHFFRQSNPPEFPTGSLLFRSKSGIGKRVVAQAHAHAALVFEFAIRLSHQASLIPVRLPLGSDPIVSARNVRLAMGATEGPILNIMRAIERLGVLVIPLSDLKDCDAFAVWAGPAREYPVIGLVTERPPDRARMNIAHELGHLVLHKDLSSGTQELERQAYRFAAELLMPSDIMRHEFASERVTLFRLAGLKTTWGVSIQALARRARDLDVINDRQYRYLMRQISMKGWRTDEPNLRPLTIEKPRAVRKLAEVAFGLKPNLSLIGRQFALTDKFLSNIFEMCAASPKEPAVRPQSAGRAGILAFKRTPRDRI
jgi:Zn-dependent peptidase ImmA (M78 family)/transcriptional regulator with XRE-family HTH domain